MRAIVEDGADLVAGSRWVPGGADIAHGLMARSLSWIINRFAMLLLGAQVHDYTSGFISGRAAVFERIRLRGDYGEYCIDLLVRARRAGFAVSEVAYVCVPRTAGDSKTGANLWDYLVKGRKYAATILRLAVQGTDDTETVDIPRIARMSRNRLCSSRGIHAIRGKRRGLILRTGLYFWAQSPYGTMANKGRRSRPA